MLKFGVWSVSFWHSMLWGICESASTTERAWTESHGSSQSPNFCFEAFFSVRSNGFLPKQRPKTGNDRNPPKNDPPDPTWRPVGNLRRGLARLAGPRRSDSWGFPMGFPHQPVQWRIYANQHDGEDSTQPYSSHWFYQFWPEQMMISQFCIYI